MRKKRITALLLCAAVLVSAATGCSGGGESEASADSKTRRLKQFVR